MSFEADQENPVVHDCATGEHVLLAYFQKDQMQPAANAVPAAGTFRAARGGSTPMTPALLGGSMRVWMKLCATLLLMQMDPLS